MAKAAVMKALQEQKDLQPGSLKWLLRLRFLTMWPLHRGAQDMAASFHKGKDPREKGRGQGERQTERQRDKETERRRKKGGGGDSQGCEFQEVEPLGIMEAGCHDLRLVPKEIGRAHV